MNRKDKVLRLLKSRVLEDVLLGVNLAYSLPSDEFHEIFESRDVQLGTYGSLYYTFYRDNKRYIFGCGRISLLNSFVNYESLFEEFNNDITPKDFKDK